MFVQKDWGLDTKGLNASMVNITNADTPYNVVRNAIRVGCVTTDGVITVNLPPPEELQGRIIEVYVDTYTSDVTVVYEGGSDITLDAVDEFTTLFSTGKDWHEVGSNHA